MFESDGLTALYQDKNHRRALDQLNAVGDVLKSRFHDMDEAVDCVLLAALSGEAMVMIGPPGTAKSRLVRSFCHLLGLVSDGTITGHATARDVRKEDYFEYLLTQFTEPSELFGFYDLTKLQKGDGMVRIDANMMQKARVVFLDEVFNASSAILNSLLTFMNERMFHDRGEPVPTNLDLMFSATNHVPTEPGLEAVFDRFLLCCWMHNVVHEGVRTADIRDLVKAGWSETHATELKADPDWGSLLDTLAHLRGDIDKRTGSGELRIDSASPVWADFTEIVNGMYKHNLSAMSNRRLVKLAGVVMARSLLRSAAEGLDRAEILRGDLDVVVRFSAKREDPEDVSLKAMLLKEHTQ